MNRYKASKEECDCSAQSGFGDMVLCVSCGSAIDYTKGYYSTINGNVCMGCYTSGNLDNCHSER